MDDHPEEAAERLALVRTLREPGIDLPAVRKIADRELTLPEVAAAHAEALDAQIAALRVRRAVLATAARQGTGAEAPRRQFPRTARLPAAEPRPCAPGAAGSRSVPEE
ncbi:hypothetical protein [Streptomyces albidoflavus]|uniref:hypothetical protein n=1 Tax=Streptomyces albidoflavus TaxID=1886 RepID=UPI0038CFA179